MILVEGRAVRVAPPCGADGRRRDHHVEGLAVGTPNVLQQRFPPCAQCGFCTPGILLSGALPAEE
jgi:aerobic-type carbon monoxide dehydrogenase small subunit (CoxS/CutS family)